MHDGAIIPINMLSAMDGTTKTFAIAVTAFSLLALGSLPHIFSAVRTRSTIKRRYERLAPLYEDEDGIADEASQKNFGDFPQRLVLVLASLAGVALATALAVLGSTRNGASEQRHLTAWLQFGGWAVMLGQSMNLYVTVPSIERFRLGAWTALSALILTVAIVGEMLLWYFSVGLPEPRNINVGLSAGQLILAVIILFTGVSIPRRPEVYKDGKPVEREFTVSLASRFTFSWPASVLDYATKNRTLTHDDLPMVSYGIRARVLRDRWDAIGKKDKLWKQIFWSHKTAFIAQWTLQIVTAITNFMPQLVLYAVLRLLEARNAGEENQFSLWLAALGMGLAVALGAWLESLLFYVCFLKLAVPVYEQLSAVIFAKALNKKDVKSAAKVDQDAEINGEISVPKKPNPEDEETAVITQENGEDDPNEEVTKTKQATINLIGVDSKRVADYCCYNYLVLGSIVKLAVAITFLVRLIGWIPTLGGFAVLLVVAPANWLMSKNYGRAQDELMKYRDQKMAVVTEALQGIRQIKMSAGEKEWYHRILRTRRKELKEQWKAFCFDTGLISCWILCPALMSAISLSIFAWLNGGLSASVAFTTLAVFEALEMTLSILPEMITELLDAIISARRIQAYLDSAVQAQDILAGDAITFKNATISWPSDEMDDTEENRSFCLHGLDLNFEMGQLNVIAGRTGSGKSLLLSAIIGEADILKGTVTVPRPPPEDQRFDSKATKENWIIPGAIAFVSQIPYVENATLRGNILFGLPYDEQRYKKVLEASALTKDLEILPDGDATEIGAQGINLSGGQKWRTCFARALYSRAGILILDDIFSAVDAHVGRQLFENALTGELSKGRTRILVTHHVALCLPRTEYIVLLENGSAARAGRVADIRSEGHLTDILAHDFEEQQKEEQHAKESEDVIVDDGGHNLTKIATNQSHRSRRFSSQSQAERDGLLRQRSRVSIITEGGEDKPREKAKKFTEDENRAVGNVSFSTYTAYIKACRGYFYWTCLVCIFLIWVGVYLGRNYWISYWTRQYDTESQHALTMQASSKPWYPIVSGKLHQKVAEQQHHRGIVFYIGVYIGISITAWLIATTRYFAVYFASIRGSHVLFEKLTETVLRTPLRWLDTTPTGRILNRFTSDFNMVDSRLAIDLGFMLHCALTCLSVVVVGLFISPFMLLFSAVLAIFTAYFAKKFLRGAREVKRLESTAKSPIFEQFSAVLTGISTIRAFDRKEAYLTTMFDKINTHGSCYWHVYAFSRWMSFRANMVGAAFNFAAVALIVSVKGIDASLAGFVLSFSLELSESTIWALRQYANVELSFNAVERVIEYGELPTEDQGGQQAPAAWPTNGQIEVDNLSVTYAPDLPPVLKNLTFSIQANERVGVVGRTGAGKSSLTLALFRFLEAQTGSITIDGIDISKITLHDLRSRLAIIPQDPVIFSGTVRSNLDPFDQHTDSELRDALVRSHLLDPGATSAVHSGTATPLRTEATDSGDTLTGTSTPINKNVAIGLNTRISESGLNLSQGQRQLLCLARAIVSRPRVLILDEATSSVDMETDKLIQQSIREEFGGRCTLIVIAHRLSTIADFDRVLVLSQGQLLEYGTPKELYQAKEAREGSFREMVERSGEKALLEETIFGRDR